MRHTITFGMDNELFPASSVASLSPRLKWLERHGLVTRRLENGRYVCHLDDSNEGRGESEDDAISDFCVKHKLKHYTDTP